MKQREKRVTHKITHAAGKVVEALLDEADKLDMGREDAFMILEVVIMNMLRSTNVTVQEADNVLNIMTFNIMQLYAWAYDKPDSWSPRIPTEQGVPPMHVLDPDDE